MKSKRLLLALALALLVPWAAIAQESTPYTEGFENMSTASDLTDAGWISYQSHSGSFLAIETSSSNVHTGTKALKIDSWDAGSNSDYVILGLPTVDAAIKTLQITFSYKISSSYGGNMEVGYLTNVGDASTFVSLQTCANSTSYATKTVELNGAPNDAARIAIKYIGYYRCYVDDIEVKVLPTCPHPTLSNEVAMTETTATVSWTPGNESQELFDLYWSTSSTTPTESITPSAANQEGNSYEFAFANLNPSSTYYVWVRGNCGTATNPDISGGWTGPVSFFTPCSAITTFPWSEDFDNYSTGNFNNQCWVNQHISGSGTNVFQVSSDYNQTGSTRTLCLPDMSTGTLTKLRLPEMNLPTADFQFSIDVYRSNSTYNSYYPNEGIRVFASADGEIEGATELAFIPRQYTVGNDIIPAETAVGWYNYGLYIPMSGTCYIILRGESQYCTSTYMDNFKVEYLKPAIASINCPTPLTATATWTMPIAATPTGFAYQYKLTDATEWGTYYETATLSADLSGLTAETTYDFRVKALYNANSSEWVTTTFTTPGYCMTPSNLVISDVTWNSATFNWGEEFGNGEWVFGYKTSLEEQYTTQEVALADLPITINGLSDNTTYDVQIYPACDGATPTHILRDNFTTKCAPIDITAEPYNNTWAEDFTDYNTGTFSDNCWENKHISGNGSYLFQISSSWNGYSKVMQLPDMAIGTLTKLMLPGITLPNSNYQFVIDVYRSNSTYNDNYPYEGIRVFASANGEIEGATEMAFIPRHYLVENEVIPAETAEGWYTYELPVPMSGLCYIILRGESQYCTSTYMDNFMVEPVPTCHRPSALAKSNVTNHSATLTWTAPEGQTAWQLAYSTTTFDPNAAGFDIETVNTVAVTGEPTYTFDKTLDADATYYMYVRANCGTTEEPDYSKWCKDGITVATLAANPAPAISTIDEIMPASAKVHWTATGDYAETFDIFYRMNTSGVPGDEEEPQFQGIEAQYEMVNNNKVYYYTINFSNEDASWCYVYVRTNHGNGDGTSAWSSYSSFSVPENCPKPSNLSAAEPTPTSLKLSWTAGAAWQTSWVIAYSTTTGFDPTDAEACTYVDAPTNPFVVEGLESETPYYFRVKGDCDTYGESEWNTTEATGTTLVACPIPTITAITDVTPHTAKVAWTTDYSDRYNVRYRALGGDVNGFFYGFEEAEPWVVDDFAPCTTYDGDGTATYGFESYDFTNENYVGACIAWQNGVISDVTAHSGNACGMMVNAIKSQYPDGVTHTDDWFILPELTIAEGDVFSFWAREIYTNYGPELVRVGIYGSTDGTFESVFGETLSIGTNTWTKFTYDLSDYVGQTIKLAINCISDDVWAFMFDDIFVGDPNNVTWDVTLSGVTSPYELEELLDDKDYEVQVEAVCGETTSGWSESANFHTPSVCTPPFNLTVDDITYNSAKLSWEGFQDNYSLQYRTASFDGYYINETWDGEIGAWSASINSSSGIDATAGIDGSACFKFSWNSNDGDYQYLISPELRDGAAGKTLTFYYRTYLSSYPEAFSVGFLDANYYEIAWDEEMTNLTNTSEWLQYETTIPEGTKHFVVYYDVYNMYYLYLDNFVIYDEDAIQEEGEWVPVPNAASPYALGSLDDETYYEWQVKGFGECTEGTEWSVSDFFITKEAVIQTTELAAGWNWFSTYIDASGAEGQNILNQLKECLGSNGIQITTTGQNGSLVYRAGRWIGGLNSINNIKGYKIRTNAPVTITIKGGKYADPEECEIPINPGWNWIAYPLSESMGVRNAMAGFTPANNDNIKTPGGSAVYVRGNWNPASFNLTPGKSYAYKSNATENKTLVFSSGNRKAETNPKANGKQFEPFKKKPLAIGEQSRRKSENINTINNNLKIK